MAILNLLEVTTGVWALAKLFRVKELRTLTASLIAGLVITAFRSYVLYLELLQVGIQHNAIFTVSVVLSLARMTGYADGVLSAIVGHNFFIDKGDTYKAVILHTH